MRKGSIGLKALLLATFALLTLSGCLGKPAEVVGTTLKTYEITDIVRPRYQRKRQRSFRVGIRDVANGRDLGRHFVSRRCYNWRKLEEGSRWTFPETTYRRENGNTYTRVDVTDLCKRLGG